MEERYIRNIPAITEDEQNALREKRILIAGCGGLGGFLLEAMVRLGVGEITAVDGDCFDVSNLNRQLLSSVPRLGTSKALAAAERAGEINPEVRVVPVHALLDESNARSLIEGRDLVLDALDNVASRLLLEDVCESCGVPLVHGAIQGWNAQAATVLPGSRLLHRLYGEGGGTFSKSALSFTPAFCAAIQSAEAAKLLCGRTPELAGKLLLADLRSMSWDVIPME